MVYRLAADLAGLPLRGEQLEQLAGAPAREGPPLFCEDGEGEAAEGDGAWAARGSGVRDAPGAPSAPSAAGSKYQLQQWPGERDPDSAPSGHRPMFKKAGGSITFAAPLVPGSHSSRECSHEDALALQPPPPLRATHDRGISQTMVNPSAAAVQLDFRRGAGAVQLAGAGGGGGGGAVPAVGEFRSRFVTGPAEALMGPGSTAPACTAGSMQVQVAPCSRQQTPSPTPLLKACEELSSGLSLPGCPGMTPGSPRQRPWFWAFCCCGVDPGLSSRRKVRADRG